MGLCFRHKASTYLERRELRHFNRKASERSKRIEVEELEQGEKSEYKFG
jgi:hypothetical protein